MGGGRRGRTSDGGKEKKTTQGAGNGEGRKEVILPFCLV